MKYLKIKYLLLSFLLLQNIAFAHCQIPCGIYDDKLRILMINEDLETIKKSIQQIKELSKKSLLDQNQINRWIITKEQHAQNIQKVISEYFLTQRIKPNSKNYEKKITLLHKLLIAAMKCKQSIKDENILTCKLLIESFNKLYFNNHDIEHLKNHER